MVKHILQAPLLHVSTEIDPHDIRSVCNCQGAFETRTRMCCPPGTQYVLAWNPGTSLAPMVNYGELISLEAMLSLSLSKL